MTHFAYRTERYAKKASLSARYANRPRSLASAPLASEVARSRTGRAAGPARPRSGAACARLASALAPVVVGAAASGEGALAQGRRQGARSP